jgi:Rieske Fe-S protein
VQAVKDRARRPIPRRQLILALCASATPFACGSKAESAQLPCADPSDGGAFAPYCLLEPRVVRVQGAARLAIDNAVLTNIDDNTAVIVARDANGFHALSGICTHACCLLTLCRDVDCNTVTSNPGECRTTSAASSDSNSAGIACPCHGSSFRLVDGTPTGGPALKPLPSYALVIDGDDALVDTANVVDAALRV